MAASRAILVYILIFVILVVLSYFFLIAPSRAKTGSSTTTVLHGTTTQLTINSSTTSNTTSTTTIYGSCVSGQPTAEIFNGNFATGNYTGWNTTGYGFGTAPLNLTYANEHRDYYNASWAGYNGVFVGTTYQGGLNLRYGNLTSDTFKVTEPYLNFKIVSPSNDALYVEIISGGKPFIVTHYNTYNVPGNPSGPSTFYNASIPLATLICQNVTVRAVAQVVGNNVNHLQYIAVGDFQLSKTAHETPGIVVNQTIV